MKLYTKIVLIIVLIYGILYLLLFWQTPLGQTPVLDGTENILLAQQIATKTLPEEPFFRSMLYPAILSVFCLLGFDNTEELFVIASALGMLSHFLSSFLIFLIVKNLWNKEKVALILALYYGLYPPVVFFAAEPLDISIAICFMLASLYFFFIAIDNNKKLYFILSGIMLGISCLVRSNILPFAIIYPFYFVINIFKKKFELQNNSQEKTITNDTSLFVKEENLQTESSINKEKLIKSTATISKGILNGFFNNTILKNTLLSFLSFSFIMILGGLTCYVHSGEFRILPWQGASNFYTANNSKANGKFYKHSIYLPDREKGTNPAKLESIIIYLKESGSKPPFKLNDFNKFWIRKTISEIISNPKHWLVLTLKKIYYLFNNYEQYNNKTFSFHKLMSPVLRYNPLCFGILIVLFFLTLTNMEYSKLFKKEECDLQIIEMTVEQSNNGLYKLLVLLSGIITLSLGIIGFYVSSRFRLPLASLFVIFSSYIFCLTKEQIINKKNLIVIFFAVLLSFSNFFDVANTSTYKEDKLLNAFACSRLGLDNKVMLWTNSVLSEDQYNLQAIRLKIVAFTNLALSGQYSNPKEWKNIIIELQYLNQNNYYFEDTMLLQGCYAYKFEKNREKAKDLWIKGANSGQRELYQAFLLYLRLVEPTESDYKMIDYSPLLAVALNKHNKQLINNNLLKSEQYNIAKQALSFLLD